MRVANRGLLTVFIEQHPDGAGAARTWLAEVERATWKTPSEVKQSFPKASIVSGGRRFVFDLRRNHYRLDAKIDYERQICLIVRIGTHSEYDYWEFDS
jgi:mRNA interferase HigB